MFQVLSGCCFILTSAYLIILVIRKSEREKTSEIENNAKKELNKSVVEKDSEKGNAKKESSAQKDS